MRRSIRKAAVLGSGVMGSGIAAHLAGCGIPVLLLDIVPPDKALSPEEAAKKDSKAVRNKFAADSLTAALKAKPPKFFSKKDMDLISVGNFEDDFEKIGDADWIIEVVVERMDIKKQIFAKVDKLRKPGSIVSTNTSGLSVAKMTEDVSEDMRKHFLGTHFFNPVRFMKLLEIIPHPDSDPEILDFMAAFCKEKLGKGVIWAKDTPNFIANRIGVYGICATMHTMAEEGLRIDEVDALVGEPMGRPKTAAFRTSDMVGLDTMRHVATTVYENCADDDEREVFKVPAFLDKLVEEGRLGDKTKAGFYTKKGKERFVLDYNSMEYVPAQKPEFESVTKAKEAKGLAARMKALVNGDDRGAKFVWKAMVKGLLYTVKRIPEISDSIVEVDRGLKWGFNWKMGPFETWDAVGVRESVERMKAEGYAVPASVLTMLEKGNETFYKKENGREYAYDLVNHVYVEIEKDPMIIILSELGKEKIVEENDGATLWDVGDGVVCLEFHTKMNALDGDIIAMQNRGLDLLDDGKFEAMIVANHAEDFSVGANLFMILMAVNNNALDQVEQTVLELQKANMRMKYCRRPVVTAPAGKVLGGGCEVAMHSWKTVGAAETYMGLVEMGVGLLPAGGGTKELTVRAMSEVPPGGTTPLLPFAQRVFETIAMAKVGIGFKESRELGHLRATDVMVPNRDLLILRAKEIAIGLAEEKIDPGAPRTDVIAAGESARAAFAVGLDGMMKAGWISEHDAKIAKKIGYVIAGGNRYDGQTVTEWELLDLEREGFMSLLGEPKTQERMQHLLMTGKPLRN